VYYKDILKVYSTLDTRLGISYILHEERYIVSVTIQIANTFVERAFTNGVCIP